MLGLKTPHLDDFTLLRYVAEDLDQSERSAASEHLEACPACQKTLHEIEELDQELSALAKDPDSRRDFELEDLPEGDPFRRRPRAAARPTQHTGDPADFAVRAVAASEEGTTLSAVILDAARASSQDLDAVLHRLDLSDLANRFALLYALQSAGTGIAQAPLRALEFAQRTLARLSGQKGAGSDESLELALPLPAILGQAHQLAGQACLWTGELEKARVHLELSYRGFSISPAAGEVNLAYTEILESQRRFFAGNAEQALCLASRAARTFESLDLEDSAARARHAEAYALTDLCRYGEALERCRDAASVFRRLGLWSNYVAAVNSLATILVKTGRLDDARREYAVALRHLSRDEHRSHLGLVRQGLGEVLFSSGRFREAATSLARAVKLFSDCGMIAHSLMTSLFEIESWARAGDLGRASHRLQLFRVEVIRRGALDASIAESIEKALSGGRPDLERLSELREEASRTLAQHIDSASA